MPIADVIAHCKQNAIPLTAVRTEPSFDKKKNRVTKGVGKTYPEWNKKKFEVKKTLVTPMDGTPAYMWMMYLRTANLFVIDVDVTGTDKVEDVLYEDVYKSLVESSDYVVRTGSGGMHFYYTIPSDIPEGSKLTDKVKVQEFHDLWVKPDCNAEIDILVDKVIVEGSSYIFDGKTYTYVAIKEGSSISKASFHRGIWEASSKHILKTPADTQKEISNALNRGIETTELEEHLANIPNTIPNWDDWYKMGQTIFNILGKDGIEVFRKWSSKCPVHDDVALEKLWNSLKTPTDNNKRTIGSILYLSEIANSDQYKVIRAKYNKLSYGAMKDMIDQSHFFVEEPKPRYVRQSERSIIEFTPTEFKDLLVDWLYELPDDNGVMIEYSFYTTYTKDPTKRRYKRIDFFPNPADCPKDVFNSFVPCEAHFLNPVPKDSVDLSIIMKHVSVMVGHNQEGIKFLLDFLAQIVQEPWRLLGIALLLYAEPGAGKDIFIDLFGEYILGHHLYYKIGKASNLFKNFNSDLVGKTFIHVDELNPSDIEKHKDDMKRIVTSGRIRAEQKGRDAFSTRSFVRLFMTTNNRDALKIDSIDRRYVVFRSSGEYRKNTAYFTTLANEFAKPEVSRAFYDLLMTRDISNFDHTTRPITAIYKEMKEASTDSILLYVRDTDCEPFDTDKPVKLKTTDWMKRYNEWASMNYMESLNVTSFGLRISELAEKNIGIVKTNPKNVSHTEINRQKVLEYIAKEIE